MDTEAVKRRARARIAERLVRPLTDGGRTITRSASAGPLELQLTIVVDDEGMHVTDATTSGPIGSAGSASNRVLNEIDAAIPDEQQAQRDYERLIGDLQADGLDQLAQQVMEIRNDEQDHERILVDMRRSLAGRV